MISNRLASWLIAILLSGIAGALVATVHRAPWVAIVAGTAALVSASVYVKKDGMDFIPALRAIVVACLVISFVAVIVERGF